jgi:hypothetical protein
MAKHLTDKDIKNIVSLLDGWESARKLTWDNLCGLVLKKHKIAIARQAMHKYVRIRKAFMDKKRGN